MYTSSFFSKSGTFFTKSGTFFTKSGTFFLQKVVLFYKKYRAFFKQARFSIYLKTLNKKEKEKEKKGKKRIKKKFNLRCACSERRRGQVTRASAEGARSRDLPSPVRAAEKKKVPPFLKKKYHLFEN